jgi:ubiquinone/menaquinone biosynthesis C-methylase UbiE
VTTWTEKRRIMERYDASSETYEGLYGEEQQRKYNKALEKVDVTNMILLDVGCGSGLLFSQVSFQTLMIVGVDLSRNLLLKAKEQARDLGDVFVVQADADHLPFKRGFFDGVFAFTMLQNMPDPTETLAELKRVAKKEGHVVVTGLKKVIPFNRFLDLLDASKLKMIYFVDDDAINCYVAVLSA